jgi:hypothetical protein
MSLWALFMTATTLFFCNYTIINHLIFSNELLASGIGILQNIKHLKPLILTITNTNVALQLISILSNDRLLNVQELAWPMTYHINGMRLNWAGPALWIQPELTPSELGIFYCWFYWY